MISTGADLKNNKTTKQESYQEYYCFLAEQFYLNGEIWKGETILYLLPIGRNEIARQENNNILDEILVSLFYRY